MSLLDGVIAGLRRHKNLTDVSTPHATADIGDGQITGRKNSIGGVPFVNANDFSTVNTAFTAYVCGDVHLPNGHGFTEMKVVARLHSNNAVGITECSFVSRNVNGGLVEDDNGTKVRLRHTGIDYTLYDSSWVSLLNPSTVRLINITIRTTDASYTASIHGYVVLVR